MSFRTVRSTVIGILPLSAAMLVQTPTLAASPNHRQNSYANPIDLPYRYQPELPYRSMAKGAYREAADPTVILFKGRYWLFPSHSWGYWWSDDLRDWHFVEGKGYQVEKFAPTVVEIGGRLYLAASENAKSIWTTDDPMSGKWTVAADVSPGYNDPALFLDDDGKLYMYEGLSGTQVLRVFELDPKTFQRIRSADIVQSRDKPQRGWEVPGDHNEQDKVMSYIEGSWMNKIGGRYYLQYAAPGTQFKTYADGVLVSDNPMGPFIYQPYSPFAAKQTGFIAGAGHGSTFRDAQGRWWHAGTMSISIRHNFERRLGLFPARITKSGELVADTYLGDYPRYMTGSRALTGWMLLSRGKTVTASSTLPGFDAMKGVDEDVRTWWAAATGDAGEWFQVDLGSPKTIEAIQINFADQGSVGKTISQDAYRYTLQISNDGLAWQTAIDRSQRGRDAPHDYRVLDKPTRARFVRIINVHAPDGGKFSLSDLRVFGKGDSAAPARVTSSTATRNPADRRKLQVRWSSSARAEFYIVRFGPRADLLNQNYQVYDGLSADIASLNTTTSYCWTVDAINEGGITAGGKAKCVP